MNTDDPTDLHLDARLSASAGTGHCPDRYCLDGIDELAGDGAAVVRSARTSTRNIS